MKLLSLTKTDSKSLSTALKAIIDSPQFSSLSARFQYLIIKNYRDVFKSLSESIDEVRKQKLSSFEQARLELTKNYALKDESGNLQVKKDDSGNSILVIPTESMSEYSERLGKLRNSFTVELKDIEDFMSEKEELLINPIPLSTIPNGVSVDKIYSLIEE